MRTIQHRIGGRPVAAASTRTAPVWSPATGAQQAEGVNVPAAVPMAYYSFGGWKDSLLGDKQVHGPDRVSFYTRGKVVTSRWPRTTHPAGRLPLPDPLLGRAVQGQSPDTTQKKEHR